MTLKNAANDHAIEDMPTKKMPWNISAKSIIAFTSVVILTYFIYLMLQIVLSYVPFANDTGFLITKQRWVTYDWWLWAFKVHVFSSGLVLFAGFSQFWGRFRSPLYRRVHRGLGYGYVIGVMALALPSGFVLACTALGGWMVQLSFICLSLLWGYTTVMAVHSIRQKQIARHQTFMTYSYALALSAITLRILKLGLYDLAVYIDWLTPIRIYRLESILAWPINLAIAWVWLRLSRRQTTR